MIGHATLNSYCFNHYADDQSRFRVGKEIDMYHLFAQSKGRYSLFNKKLSSNFD